MGGPRGAEVQASITLSLDVPGHRSSTYLPGLFIYPPPPPHSPRGLERCTYQIDGHKRSAVGLCSRWKGTDSRWVVVIRQVLRFAHSSLYGFRGQGAKRGCERSAATSSIINSGPAVELTKTTCSHEDQALIEPETCLMWKNGLVTKTSLKGL